MDRSKKIPRARDGVLSISPYVGGVSAVEGVENPAKLSSNETPLGPSQKVFEALQAAQGHLEEYPDGGALKLRQMIADKFGLNPENIICGNGSDEIFRMVTQAYLGPGDNTLYSEHGFLVYDIVTRACDATPIKVPEKNLTADADAFLAAVNEKTKMVFIANPNNPTGTYMPVDEVKRLHAGLPSDVLLVLDAAYAEYVRQNDYEAGIELVSTNNNVIMTRTFSKIYGLAALRLGWAYCPKEVVGVLHRLRPPFNVNSLALVAGVAALEDTAHVEKSYEHNLVWRSWLFEKLTGLGLTVTPSVANFLLLHFKDVAQAEDAYNYLCSQGFILRAVKSYGLPHCLRLSVGDQAACEGVVAALQKFLDGLKS